MGKQSIKGITDTVSVTSEADAQLYMDFCREVVAGGFVPADVLREKFGATAFTKCIALLYSTHRLLVEKREPWTQPDGTVADTLGYRWADKRYSQAMLQKMPPELANIIKMFQKPPAKYGEYFPCRVRCRFTNKSLGGHPVDDGADTINAFDRVNGAGSDALIQRYNQRAMISVALPMVKKEAALANRIRFTMLRFPAQVVKRVFTVPVPPSSGPSSGRGMMRFEYLEAGTEFIIDAMLPGSVIKVDEFAEALRVAGERVGLSCGRSAGYGDFEVLQVLGDE